MDPTPLDNRLERWERRIGAASVATPYLLLAVATLLALLEGGRSAASHAVTAALAALAALWLVWAILPGPNWARRALPMAGYCAGLIALIALLLSRSPWFGIFAFTGYLHSWAFLRGNWRYVGVAATAAISTAWFMGGLPGANVQEVAAYLVLVAIIVVLVGVFSSLGEVTQRQSQQRKGIIAELAAANSKLEATLAENAGLHAQLLTQARESGILDERQRMAREIHDTLAQGFTGIIAQLEAARQARLHAGAWEGYVEQAQDLARESLAEARRSVQALRPAPLDGARLPEALAELAARWSATAAVPLQLVTTGDPRPLAAEVEVALYRVAQESLANVAKHAGASRVGLTLSYTGDMVLLDIRDDGVGFDAETVAVEERPADGTGFGLGTMRQRVRQVGGTLTIESAPGMGAAINASVPIPGGEGVA